MDKDLDDSDSDTEFLAFTTKPYLSKKMKQKDSDTEFLASTTQSYKKLRNPCTFPQSFVPPSPEQQSTTKQVANNNSFFDRHGYDEF